MRLVEQQLASSILAQAQALRQGAVNSARLTGMAALAVLIFVLLATLIIARSMMRPLRLLKVGALEVAGVRLPAEVSELSRAGDTGQGLDVEPIDVHSTDEIGQVARAFDQVHREAVRLAADEAKLRSSVSAMFMSLSRRSQTLLERLLRLIDSLELGEQDPERLANLFRMDHLATRMRRNSENLLVLAGHEAPRRWAEPVSLVDVVRASVSEIEQYDRVVISIQPGIAVIGNAVADTVHLLAEILENATMFSAKSTQVTVSGHALSNGEALIDVADKGMGMSEQQLAQLNRRLENPPVADVEVSRPRPPVCCVAPEIPNNWASLALFRMAIPEGSILNAPRPYPVSVRHVIGQLLPDLMMGCLHQAVPDRVVAEGSSCLWNPPLRGGGAVSGQATDGRRVLPDFEVITFNSGGTGARPGRDGLDGTAFPSGVRTMPVEATENVAPIIVWRKELRPDSGGPGRTRGGFGQVMEIGGQDDLEFACNAIFDRIAAERARRRPVGRGRAGRAQIGRSAARQGLPSHPGRRAPGAASAGRRRHGRSGRTRSSGCGEGCARRARIRPVGRTRLPGLPHAGRRG